MIVCGVVLVVCLLCCVVLVGVVVCGGVLVVCLLCCVVLVVCLCV